jgi:hypothetical protein
MKIFITGCTSQQSSLKASERMPTFASCMATALREQGAYVEMSSPSIHKSQEELATYDKVLVGIAPPTSLAANWVYPAFAIANRAKKIGNLSLFIDAPEPYKISASLKSVYTGKSSLLKDFYSMRKNHSEMNSNKEFKGEVLDFLTHLHKGRWENTIFPTLPWSASGDVTAAIQNLDSDNLTGVSVDTVLINDKEVKEKSQVNENKFWTLDYSNTKWSKQIENTLNNKIVPTRGNRWENSREVSSRIRDSLGTLIAV